MSSRNKYCLNISKHPIYLHFHDSSICMTSVRKINDKETARCIITNTLRRTIESCSLILKERRLTRMKNCHQVMFLRDSIRNMSEVTFQQCRQNIQFAPILDWSVPKGDQPLLHHAWKSPMKEPSLRKCRTLHMME